MKKQTIPLLVFAAAFGALSVYSALLAQREYTAFRAGKTWGVAEFQKFSGETLALSHKSNQYWVDGCLRAVTSIEGRLLYDEARALLHGSCQDVISSITEAAPNNAYAWYFQAYLALSNGSEDEFNAALLNSYEFGPAEQWIAELRVPMAERGMASLDAQALNGHLNDLGLLVQSRRGIKSIARRYVRDPDFRGRLTDVVETLPQSAQQRFLRTLKSEVARFQNGG